MEAIAPLSLDAFNLRLARLAKDEFSQEVERLLCREDPCHFLRYFCITADQHPPPGVDPYRPFPAHKAYLIKLTRAWQENPIVVVAKSRQMLVSWLFCALFFWDALFRSGRVNVCQSMDKDSAAELIWRMSIMAEKLPSWLRPPGWPGKDDIQTFKIQFPGHHSKITSIPAGADQARGLTGSNIFLDEFAKIKDATDSWVASLPAIKGGGKLVVVSSAWPGSFHALYEGRVDQLR